jgi:hypothetical protein
VPVKIIMTWDIAPEKEKEYFEFVVREFIPGVQRLGFEMSDAWATIYGSHPQIMVAATIPSMQQAKELLDSADWISLSNQLQDFVKNYSVKLVEARGSFQF